MGLGEDGYPGRAGPRIRQLVQQLGDTDYNVRQRAQDDLAKLGFAAFDLLSEAAESEDLEIATRAKYLLHLMRVQWTREDDPPAVKALLDGYDALSLEGRMARMQSWRRCPRPPAWRRFAGWCVTSCRRC